VAVQDLNFKLESDSSAPRLAREELLALRQQLPAEAFSDLTVILSELVANSVKYGPGKPIEVNLHFNGEGKIHGVVDDCGTTGVAIAESDSVEASRLGLLIVDSLATSWGVHPDSTRVWFRLEPDYFAEIVRRAERAQPG
jgi:two-component sensor histidine kinase